MAEEKQENTEKKQEGGFNMKMIIVGLPLFIVQLIAVYFITANFLMDKFAQNAAYENLAEDVKIVEQVPEEELNDKSVLYNIDDLVVNPYRSNGNKLLLVSMALELPNEEAMNQLTEKDVIVKDKIINILSKKTQQELSVPAFKDTLKTELKTELKVLFPEVEINSIYFSKFILD